MLTPERAMGLRRVSARLIHSSRPVVFGTMFESAGQRAKARK